MVRMNGKTVSTIRIFKGLLNSGSGFNHLLSQPVLRFVMPNSNAHTLKSIKNNLAKNRQMPRSCTSPTMSYCFELFSNWAIELFCFEQCVLSYSECNSQNFLAITRPHSGGLTAPPDSPAAQLFFSSSRLSKNRHPLKLLDTKLHQVTDW